MIKDFDTSIRLLHETALEIHEKAYGGMAEHKLWMNCINKFFVSYIRSKAKSTSFYPMFLKFYTKHRDTIAKPVFIGEGDNFKVNDQWIKNGPSATASVASRSGWQPPSMVKCSGHVIYYDESTPRLAAISIPITELYKCALGVYKEHGKSSPSALLYPTKVLYYLYSIFYNVISGDLYPEKESVITKNCKVLYDELSVASQEEKRSSTTGLGGLGNIVGEVMKHAGVDNKEFDPDKIGDVLSNSLGGNNLENVGKAVGSVLKAIRGNGEKAPESIGDIFDGLGKALQSDDIKNIFSQTVGLSLSAKEKAIEVADAPSIDPSEQE